MKEYKVPFSQDYVLRETLKHMQNTVSISTQKTIARMTEFENDQEKIKEILSTLANLNRIAKMIEEFKDNNKELIEEVKS